MWLCPKCIVWNSQKNEWKCDYNETTFLEIENKYQSSK